MRWEFSAGGLLSAPTANATTNSGTVVCYGGTHVYTYGEVHRMFNAYIYTLHWLEMVLTSTPHSKTMERSIGRVRAVVEAFLTINCRTATPTAGDCHVHSSSPDRRSGQLEGATMNYRGGPVFRSCVRSGKRHSNPKCCCSVYASKRLQVYSLPTWGISCAYLGVRTEVALGSSA